MSTPKTEDLHFVTPRDDGRLAISNDQVSLKQDGEYEVENMCGSELRAILNPRDCEYVLTIDTPQSKYAFEVTENGVNRLFDTGKEMSWSPADVFTLFYTATTFTISNLVDLRKSNRGRATCDGRGELKVHAPNGTGYRLFAQDIGYSLEHMTLWEIRALERPLDCGYSVVLEHNNGGSREVSITPNTCCEVSIGLYNYDFMTITDIWNEEGK